MYILRKGGESHLSNIYKETIKNKKSVMNLLLSQENTI